MATGPWCEVSLSPCDPSPCFYGYCEEREGQPNCICDPGFQVNCRQGCGSGTGRICIISNRIMDLVGYAKLQIVLRIRSDMQSCIQCSGYGRIRITLSVLRIRSDEHNCKWCCGSGRICIIVNSAKDPVGYA